MDTTTPKRGRFSELIRANVEAEREQEKKRAVREEKAKQRRVDRCVERLSIFLEEKMIPLDDAGPEKFEESELFDYSVSELNSETLYLAIIEINDTLVPGEDEYRLKGVYAPRGYVTLSLEKMSKN